MTERALPRALAALILGAACATSTPDGSVPVEIRTTADAFAPGRQAELVIENRSDRELGYNLCASMELDRRDGDGWDPLPRDPDRVCTMELRLVPAGEVRTGIVQVPSDLDPGVYRFRFVGLQWSDGSSPPPGPIHTAAFEVEPG